jgi:iron only hydrogenase large subunit-like protein
LEDEQFDDPMGESTGAGVIFGVTGGVMEAALRTVYFIVTGRELPYEQLHVEPIVGLDQIKEVLVKFENVLPEYEMFEGFEAKVGVTSGLAGARILMEQIEAGTSPYHFIEVMGCPSGCICGGGQPRSDDPDVRTKRMKAIYTEDEGKTLRQSHLNPSITAIDEKYLGNPCGHLSHELLHTHYVDRSGESD